MKKLSTSAYTTKYGNIHGQKLYEQRARSILPALIRQAKAKQTVTYGHLSAEFGMPNARNLNYPLGTIGGALSALSDKWGEKVPPIQALVVNDSTGLPGTGISDFLEHPKEYLNSGKEDQQATFKELLRHIYRYPNWDDVLSSLGIESLTNKPPQIPKKKIRPKYPKGSVESRAHKELKEYVAKNPEVANLARDLAPGETEYTFLSLDAVDLLFENKRQVIGVEVKSAISKDDDLERGLYQCVKYAALLHAREKVRQTRRDIHVILVVGKSFPGILRSIQNTLGIDVRDDIRVV